MTQPTPLEGLSMSELKQHIQQEHAAIELRREQDARLDSEFEALKQERAHLKQHICALQRKIRNAILPRISYDTFRLEQKTEKILEEAEEHKTICQEMEGAIPRKTEEKRKEAQRAQRLLGEVEKARADWEVLERAADMSPKFRDGQDLVRHVEVLEQMRHKYRERLSAARQRGRRLREELREEERTGQVEASEMGLKMRLLQEEQLRLQGVQDAVCGEHDDVLRRKDEYFGPAQFETAILNVYDTAIPQTAKTDAGDIIALLDRVQEFITDNYEVLDQYAKQYGSP